MARGAAAAGRAQQPVHAPLPISGSQRCCGRPGEQESAEPTPPRPACTSQRICQAAPAGACTRMLRGQAAARMRLQALRWQGPPRLQHAPASGRRRAAAASSGARSAAAAGAAQRRSATAAGSAAAAHTAASASARGSSSAASSASSRPASALTACSCAASRAPAAFACAAAGAGASVVEPHGLLVSASQRGLSAGAVILACAERGGGSADASARRMPDLTDLWTSLRSASGVSPSGRHGARRCMQEEGVLRARLLERQLAAAQARLHRPAQLVGLGGRHGVRGAQPLQAQAARQPQHQRAAAGRAGVLAPQLLRPTAQRVSARGAAAATGRTCRSAVMLSTSPCRLTRAAEGTPAVAPPGHCSMAPVALATLSLAHRLSYSSQNLVCAGAPTGLSQAGRSGRPAAWQHPDLGLCNPTSATNQANNLVSQRLASKGDDSELASLRRSPQPKNMAVLHHVGLPGTHLWSSTARPLPAVLPALAHALSCAELPACAHAPPSALGWSSALLRAAIDEHTSGDHVCMQAQDLEMLCALGSDGLHRTSASWG